MSQEASGLLLSCSALLISSIVSNSHFFLSCLVEIIAFLCPMFVPMFLVLFALFTLSAVFVKGGTPGTRLGAVLGVCFTFLNKLRLNADEGIRVQPDASFEGSEVYKIIFEEADLESGQHGTGSEESELHPVDKFPIYDVQGISTLGASSPRNRMDGNHLLEKIAQPDIESGKETRGLEGTVAEAKVEAKDEDLKKVVVDQEKRDFNNSRGNFSKINVDGKDNSNVLGSMRRRKKWNHTLAYKLTEERHNMEGEGMDSLWEEACNGDESESRNKDAKRSKPKKKVDVDRNEDKGILCCLQALRLSAGRMGRRRPPMNLVKISKAFRGIGWLSPSSHQQQQQQLTFPDIISILRNQ